MADNRGSGPEPQGQIIEFNGDLHACAAKLRNVSFSGLGLKPALSFTLFRDIDTAPKKDWLVHNILGAGEISAWFGGPGAGKSLIATDLAFHIAARMRWFDRHTMGGAVLCVLAERLAVSQRRIAALGKHHGYDDIPLAVVGGPADLRSSKRHAQLIIDYANRLCDLSGLPLDLLTVETVNRVLAGGDENHPKDMGQLIGILAEIQDATKAHVLAVHHTPLDGDRLRGHGALNGACDTTILVRKVGHDLFTGSVKKVNDGPDDEQIAFTLKSIDLHFDEETGIMTTAPVVIPTPVPAEAKQGPTLTANQKTMLNILKDAGDRGLTQEEWYARAKAEGIGEKRKASLSDAKRSLAILGLIYEDNDRWRAFRRPTPS